MRKLCILLVVICMLAGSFAVHAENWEQTDSISLGEVKVVTIPEPEGEIAPGWVYFTQVFTFVPEEDGEYCFLVRYEEDPSDPYEFTMDVAGSYRELTNGCLFEGKAGESYELCFQYPTHDGRYPEFTFCVTSGDVREIPKTSDAGILPSFFAFGLSGAALVLLMARKKRYA